jgi:hypothetical protein
MGGPRIGDLQQHRALFIHSSGPGLFLFAHELLSAETHPRGLSLRTIARHYHAESWCSEVGEVGAELVYRNTAPASLGGLLAC